MAAYCRVSTELEEQQSSYENQVRYYSDFIQSNPTFELIDIYADEGLSGTSTKKRSEFNRMIKDCKEGKIDRIFVKSISRFARNTLDCIRFVRELKELGVGITFEKENIDSLDAKGEVLLTILSSLAQDESRSISENATWGIRKRFERGINRQNTTKFMGYDKDEDGNLIINEEQAKVVRRIFRMFLMGQTPESIARRLNNEGVAGWSGKANWYPSSIQKMLHNERYKGDLLLQKTVTVDFLNKRRAENKGHANQYYVEGNHEPIIEPWIWDAAKLEFERRETFKQTHGIKNYAQNIESNPFSSKVFCGVCGSAFARKHWTTTRGKRAVWQCGSRYKKKGELGCSNSHIDEETLQKAFFVAIEELLIHQQDCQQKWQKMIDEGTPLERYQATVMREEVLNGSKEFKPDLMVSILEKIIVGEQVAVQFVEGTEMIL
ncbi:TPA: recombinase family protein [Streptococcus equi subsp. zooepidemicus]|nr:recombinase family protein [Streptococcus equi subsp. zooepidemicus]